MRLAISLGGKTLATGEALGGLVALATLAEELGVDQLGVPDHVVFATEAKAYPYGGFPQAPDTPYPEPLTLCAAVAAATSRIELCPSVLIVPLRPAVLLAKTCATLDRLSHGRLVLGAGTGWQEAEFAASGVPFAGRGARMDDTLRACRALWSGGPATFASETVSFEGMICEPAPAGARSIRILVGSDHVARSARRIADYADGWAPRPKMPPAELADGLAQIRAARMAAGGSPDDIEVKCTMPVAGGDIERILEESVPDLAQAGATIIQVSVGPFVESPAEAPAFVERLAGLFEAYRAL